MMDFKRKFISVWHKFLHFARYDNDLAVEERRLKWTKAQMNVLASGGWPDYKEWLESLMFDYFHIGRNENISPEKRLTCDAKANTIDMIIEETERSKDLIDNQEKNVEHLRRKSAG